MIDASFIVKLWNYPESAQQTAHSTKENTNNIILHLWALMYFILFDDTVIGQPGIWVKQVSGYQPLYMVKEKVKQQNLLRVGSPAI